MGKSSDSTFLLVSGYTDVSYCINALQCYKREFTDLEEVQARLLSQAISRTPRLKTPSILYIRDCVLYFEVETCLACMKVFSVLKPP